jgi:hypothetical protein
LHDRHLAWRGFGGPLHPFQPSTRHRIGGKHVFDGDDLIGSRSTGKVPVEDLFRNWGTESVHIFFNA